MRSEQKSRITKIFKRTSENYTHDVITDAKIKWVTAYRKSKFKFRINIFLNILTFGMIYILSKFFPKLYLKFYCNESSPSNSDYFLVEDENNNITLCETEHKKILIKKLSTNNTSILNNSKEKTIHCKNTQTILFEYNRNKYEYDEKENSLMPIFFDLSGMTNKKILEYYTEGISSRITYKSLLDKYGQNIMRIDVLTLVFFAFVRLYSPQVIISFLSGIIFLLDDDIYFGIIIIILNTIIAVLKLLYKYYNVHILHNDSKSLDGSSEIKFKAKRKFMQIDLKEFCTIANIDIVPGDVLLLKEGDILPCDGILLDGVCIITESKLNENVSMIIKYPLENNNNDFDYSKKDNILLHGMKIKKIYSKNFNKEIAILAINTGANTYKANKFSNIIFIKKEKNILHIPAKKINYIFNTILFISSIITLYVKYFYAEHKIGIIKYITIIFGLILMPMYHMTNFLLKHLGVIGLTKHKIQCINEAKLIEAGKINTVIFSKTGTLSQRQLEICGYYPVYKELHSSKLFFKIFDEHTINNMCNDHLKYYRTLLENPNLFPIDINTSERFIPRNTSKSNLHSNDNLSNNNYLNIMNDDCNSRLTAAFLECLVCCNKLVKINNEICGNFVDQQILKSLKWDINTCINDFDNNNISLNDKVEIECEVFPKNYFKITEGIKAFSALDNGKMNKSELLDKDSSFKILVLKKFYTDYSMNVSCIAYNIFEKKYKFMIKGFPEQLLQSCLPHTIPNDIKKQLNLFRKKGFMVIICAVKDLYGDINTILKKNDSYFINRLHFCGFISFKNQLKKDVKQTIKKLKDMKCEIIMSTGDNIYTSLNVAYDCGIIPPQKNIQAFELDQSLKEITVSDLCSVIDDSENNYKQKSSCNNSSSNNLSNHGVDKKNIGKKNTFLAAKIHKKDIKHFHIGKHGKSFYKEKNINNHNEDDTSYKKILGQNDNYDFSDNYIFDDDVSYPGDGTLDKDDYSKSNSPASFYNDEIINSKNTTFRNTINPGSSKRFKESIHSGIVKPKRKRNSTISVNKLKQDDPNIRKRVKKFRTDQSDVLPLEQIEEFQKHPSNQKLTENNENINQNLEKIISISGTNGFESKRDNIIENEIINASNTNSIINNKNKSKRPSSKITVDLINSKLTPKNTQMSISKNETGYYIPEKELSLYKHSLLCFSGEVVRFIYQYRKNPKLSRLIKFLKHNGKIFYSMTSNDKKLLIYLYDEFSDKRICMVGDSFNDIDARLVCSVGVNLCQHKSRNMLTGHFYITETGLSGIEIIIKIGRCYYENNLLLLYSNIILTVLAVLFILASYYLEAELGKIKLTVLNISDFLLFLTAFCISADLNIDYNYLITNRKIFRLFYLFQVIGIFIIKAIGQIILFIYYRVNNSVSVNQSQNIELSYYYVLIYMQSLSTLFALNSNSLYRRSMINNIPFLMLFIILFAYFFASITFTDIALTNDTRLYFSFLDFEYLRENIDVFDDNHKLNLIYIILADFALSFAYVKCFKILFEKRARSLKKNEEGMVDKDKNIFELN